MTRRRIFLIIMILLTALAIFDGFNLRSFLIFETNGTRGTGFKLEFQGLETSKTDSLVVDASQLSTLALINQSGNVQIIGEERDNVQIDYQIIVKHLHEEDATAYLDKIEFQHQIVGNQLQIETPRPSRPSSGIFETRTDYQILVPINMNVDVKADYGEIEIRNLNSDVSGKFRYATQNSMVTDLTGNIALNWSYSTAEVTGITGDLNLNSAYSQLTVSDVTGNMELDGNFTGIWISNLGNDLNFKTKYGAIDISDLAGDLIGEASYTGIKGDKIGGAIKLHSKYGAVDLREVANKVDITLLHAPLALTLKPREAGYLFDVDVTRAVFKSDLKLEADQITSNRTRYAGTYQAGQIPINVKSEYGDVAIDTK